MAQSTTARTRGRTRGTGPTRSPELDMARAVALACAVVLLVAPGPLPSLLARGGGGVALADLLPAAFATIAGVAVAHQQVAHAGASPGWWTGRVTRRIVVLVAAGLLLQLLVLLPTPAAALARLRLTGDLARIGVASGLAIVLVRLPARTRAALAAALVTAHAVLVFATGAPPEQGGALAGWDARLLAGRALRPVDPDGLTALAPTLALVLVGAAVGAWLRGRPRGARTVALLLAGAGTSAAAAWLLARVLPPLAAVWSPPILAGGVAVVLALLGLGQLGTRHRWSDRAVATLAVAGQVSLPLWLLAVVAQAWFGSAPPLRWFVREVLWPPLGDIGSSLALGLLAVAALVRTGTAMVDRGWTIRA